MKITRWLDDADGIYGTYLSPNAMFQVNVSYEHQRKPRHRLRQLRQRVAQLGRPGAMMMPAHGGSGIYASSGAIVNVNNAGSPPHDHVSPLINYTSRKLTPSGGGPAIAAPVSISSSIPALPPPTLVVTGAAGIAEAATLMTNTVTNNPNNLSATSPVPGSSPNSTRTPTLMRLQSNPMAAGSILAATPSSPPGAGPRLFSANSETKYHHHPAASVSLNTIGGGNINNMTSNGGMSGRLNRAVSSKQSNGPSTTNTTFTGGVNTTATTAQHTHNNSNTSLPGAVPRRSISATSSALPMHRSRSEHKLAIAAAASAASSSSRPATANVASIMMMNQKIAAVAAAAAMHTKAPSSPSNMMHTNGTILHGSALAPQPSTVMEDDASHRTENPQTPPLGPLTTATTDAITSPPSMPLLDPTHEVDPLSDDDDEDEGNQTKRQAATITAPMLSSMPSSHSPLPPSPLPLTSGRTTTTNVSPGGGAAAAAAGATTTATGHTIARSLSRAESASEYSVYLPSAVGNAAVTQAPPHVQAETLLQDLASVFDSQQVAVMQLMRTNSLPRFLLSAMYQQLLQSLRGWVGGGGSRARGQPQFSYLAPASVLHASMVGPPGGGGGLHASANPANVSQNGHMRPIVEDSHGGMSSGLAGPVGSTASLPSPPQPSDGLPRNGIGSGVAHHHRVGSDDSVDEQDDDGRPGSSGGPFGGNPNKQHEPSMAVDSVISSMANMVSAAQRSPHRSAFHSIASGVGVVAAEADDN
jgi:hypothetical protein